MQSGSFFSSLRVVLLCGYAAFLLTPGLASPVAGGTTPPLERVTIGVQIIEDSAQEREQWQHWVQQWQVAVPHLPIQMQPLRWDALQAAVQAQQLQFVVSSPGHYVALETRYGAVRLASQLTQGAANSRQAVGSAVVVSADSPWRTLDDVRQQPVAAVAEDAFGGYQVMAAQWRRQGWKPADMQTVFTGYPMEKPLQALRDGKVQAAILRVCMLEQWVARGVVSAQAYRVLPLQPQDVQATSSSDCQSSSLRYPGWALAALPGTPQNLSHDVLLAVLSPAQSGEYGRWTVPADYQSVHEVLRVLQVEPYAPAPALPWPAWLWGHRWWGLGALLVIALVLAYLRHVDALVQRRTAALKRTLQERDALAQQVAQAREQMDHMGRLSVLGELSATLAHEISHPLASLSNYVTGLRSRYRMHRLEPEQLGSALDAMEDAVARTARVLDSVRALARKRVSVQKQSMLWPVVCETVELLQAMTSNAAQPLQVQLECAPELQQVQVVIDALQVQQVVLNLLKNAQELHSTQGRHTLPVMVSLAWGSEPDTVVVAVCDHGSPMPPEAVARLFEPFYTTKPQGLGLGLAISRNIAELHGGHLQARSQAGAGGLCMELVLPLAPRPGQRRGAHADSTSPPTAEAQSFPGKSAECQVNTKTCSYENK